MQYNQSSKGELLRKELSNIAEINGIDIMFIDGHDNAIVGLGRQFNKNAVIYSKNQIIKNLCSEMTEEEAEEFYEFNIAGAYVGESTPIVLEDFNDFME